MVFLQGTLDFAGGFVIAFVGIILAGWFGYDAFLWLGFPKEWFASDYSDPRGSALCAILQFAGVLMVSLVVGGILRNCGVNLSMGRALRAMNPLVWLSALLAVMLFKWPFEPELQIFGVWSAIVALVGWVVIVPILLYQARVPHP